jgi:hypothetical protein
MSGRGLEVKITADVIDLQTKLAIANAEYKANGAAMQKLAKSTVGASDEIKASLNPMLVQQQALLNDSASRVKNLKAQVVNLGTASEATGGMFGRLTAGVTGVGEKVEAVRAKLAVFQTAVSSISELMAAGFGVDMVAEQIGKVAEMGEQYAHLTQQTGATTMQLGGLRLAAMETGTDFDNFGNAMRSLGMQMQMALTNPASKAAQAFRAAAVTITDSSGHLLPVVDVFAAISQSLNNFQDGTEKTALAGDMLGTRFGTTLVPMMNQVGAGFDQLQEKAQSYGLVMSQDAIDNSEKFKQAQADVTAALVGLRNQIVASNLPAFTALDEVFVTSAQKGGALSDVGGVLEYSLKGLADITVAVVTALDDLFTAADTAGHTIGDMAVEVVAAGEALTGHFALALQTAKAGVDDLATSYEHLGHVFMANERLFTATETALFSDIPVRAANPDLTKMIAPGLSGGIGVGGHQGAGGADPAMLGDNIDTSGVDSSDGAGGGSTRVAKAQTTENKITQIASATAEAQKQIASSQYDEQVAIWETQVAQGKMTKAQEIQDEIAAQAVIYQSDLNEAQKEAALDVAGTAAKAKALDDVQVLTAQHNAEMARMHTELISQEMMDTKRLLDEQNKAAAATQAAWQKAFQPITQAVDASVNGVIQGTQTMQQAEMKAAQSIALAFIDAEAKKLEAFTVGEIQILARAVMTETGMTAATVAGESARLTAKTTAAATGKAVDTALTAAQINKNAATAATGAYAAVAPIPYVGPVLAPIAAATAFAGVMAYDVLSASGGLEIGPGVNPLVQLHENETVLPAYIAKPLTSMLENNSLTNGNTTGDTSVTNHFNLTAHGSGNGMDAHEMLTKFDSAVRSGSLQRYPAIARMMRR